MRVATAAERHYLGAVAALGCAVCRRLGLGQTPAIVHHQRTGTGKMRASHYRTTPLCPYHHQFSGAGVHDMGREEFEAMYGFSEVDLIEETRELLKELLPAHELEGSNDHDSIVYQPHRTYFTARQRRLLA